LVRKQAMRLHSGYTSSRPCEIGLSEMAHMPDQSILYMLERCSKAPG
jgi:hypothetical protein